MDIIPFHGVESPERTIVWPDDHVMQVLGFEEALATSVTVRLLNVEVAVASLPAQTILKLLAWRDRHLINQRDAKDLRPIITAYSEGYCLDDLYENHQQTLASYDFDVRLAGADRLGQEALSILAQDGANTVVDLVTAENSPEGRLPAQMDGPIQQNRELLAAVLGGMHRNLRERG